MKQAEVQLSDPLYQRVERLAKQLHLSVPELLRRAAEQLVQRAPEPREAGAWQFPEGQHLGTLAAEEDWRLLANEPGKA